MLGIEKRAATTEMTSEEFKGLEAARTLLQISQVVRIPVGSFFALRSPAIFCCIRHRESPRNPQDSAAAKCPISVYLGSDLNIWLYRHRESPRNRQYPATVKCSIFVW